MTPKILSFSTRDGLDLGCRWWDGRSGYPVVVHLHGIQSHGGWFEYSCACYAHAGFHVFAPDRRGSGLNKALGTHDLTADLLLDDLERGINFALARAGTTRFFLIGVSWGGKLAVAYVSTRKRPQGLVLVAPGLFPKVGYPLHKKVLIMLALLFRSRKRFPIPITDPPLFTANPDRQRFIAEDPDMLRLCDAALFRADFDLGRIVKRARRQNALPTFLCLATHDDIISNKKTLTFLEEWAQNFLQIRVYPGTRHTLEFEPDPDPWIHEVIDWMEQIS